MRFFFLLLLIFFSGCNFKNNLISDNCQYLADKCNIICDSTVNIYKVDVFLPNWEVQIFDITSDKEKRRVAGLFDSINEKCYLLNTNYYSSSYNKSILNLYVSGSVASMINYSYEFNGLIDLFYVKQFSDSLIFLDLHLFMKILVSLSNNTGINNSSLIHVNSADSIPKYVDKFLLRNGISDQMNRFKNLNEELVSFIKFSLTEEQTYIFFDNFTFYFIKTGVKKNSKNWLNNKKENEYYLVFYSI